MDHDAPRPPPIDDPAVAAATEPVVGAVRASLDAGDALGAAARVVVEYGAEVFGFVVGVLDEGAAADGVYQRVLGEIARGVASFSWSCSLQIWTYALASREIAALGQRSVAPAARGAAPSVTLFDPSTTVSRRPTHMRQAIAAIRRDLAPDDRALLILRLDRQLAWSDLAIVTLGELAPHVELARESERLRLRFDALRRELASAAIEHRLLEPR